MWTPASPRAASTSSPWDQPGARLLAAACTIVLFSLVLIVGLLSPAQAAWGVSSMYEHAGKLVSRMTPPCPGKDSIARANAVHLRALEIQGKELAEFNVTKHNREFMLLDMWDTIGPTFSCAEKERFGERFEGGKWVCSPFEILSPEPCFVFSLGCNGVSGFEEDVRARYPHCVIHIYDPTIGVNVAEKVADKTQGFVHRKWITGEANVDAPHEYPDTPRGKTWGREWTTLEREMKAHGAKWLNILKIDIEGSEFQLLDDFFKERHPMPFSEILIEIHIPKLENGPGVTWGDSAPARMKYMFDQLIANGFRVANTELNLRCGKHVDRGCLNYIEMSLVKTDVGGNVMLAQQ